MFPAVAVPDFITDLWDPSISQKTDFFKSAEMEQFPKFFYLIR